VNQDIGQVETQGVIPPDQKVPQIREGNKRPVKSAMSLHPLAKVFSEILGPIFGILKMGILGDKNHVIPDKGALQGVKIDHPIEENQKREMKPYEGRNPMGIKPFKFNGRHKTISQGCLIF
jgi:hypothetical protein